IFESKGRMSRENNTLDKAKEQSCMVNPVNGYSPKFKVGVMSHYNNNILKIDAIDPDEKSDDSIDMKIDKNAFLVDYYSQVFSFIHQNPQEEITYGDLKSVTTKNDCLDF